MARVVEMAPSHTGWKQDLARFDDLERDDFSSNRHLALPYCWSMIFSENRYPLFGIMLYSAATRLALCGARSRKCGRISWAIAVMLARAISFGMVPNWVLVSDVLKPARS